MSATEVAAQLYDGKGGVQTTELDDAQIARRSDDQLLWIDLLAPDDDELEHAADAVGLELETLRRLLDDSTENGTLDDQGETIGVHGFAIEQAGDGYDREPLDGGSFVAFLLDWLFTRYMVEIEQID